MRRTLLLLLFAVACGGSTGPRPESAQSIDIQAPIPKAAAADRVAAAMVGAGYTVLEATPTVVRTQRRTFKNVWHLQVVANIVAVDATSSRIVLTGDYTVDVLHPQPITAEQSDSGISGEMWKQMTAVADVVKQSVSR